MDFRLISLKLGENKYGGILFEKFILNLEIISLSQVKFESFGVPSKTMFFVVAFFFIILIILMGFDGCLLELLDEISLRDVICGLSRRMLL